MAEKTTSAKPPKNTAPAAAHKVTTEETLRSPSDQVTILQKTFGNRTVGQLLRSGKLQAALKIGQPNDIYEQEADRVADQVMRMPDASSTISMRNNSSFIQRTCAPCSREYAAARQEQRAVNPANLCPKCAEENKLKIRRKAESATDSGSSVPDNFVSSLGTGQPLDRSTREYLEPRFRADFSNVRVHTNQMAAKSASSINALAYTLGRNVVFGAGQYQPNTVQGKRLLAHELTHVVQQASLPHNVQRTITIDNITNTTPPHTQNNGALAVSLFNQLCPDISWHLNGATIEPVSANDCNSTTIQQGSTPTACECVCDFTKTTGPHANIEFNQTDDDTVSIGQNSYRIRLTGQGAQGIRGIQGAAPAAGTPIRAIADPAWVILGHELCGHARTTYPLNATSSSTFFHQMSQDWNKTAVDIENRIRQEHNAAHGAGLGMRIGEFEDVDGDVHAGSLIQLPRAMSLADLLRELAVPVLYKHPRCVRQDYFYPCMTIPTAEADMRNIPIVNRVTITDNGNQVVPWSCRNNTFPQGTAFNVEGVFWHRAVSGDTKQSIAGQWGVSISAINRANRLFGNGIDAIPDSQALSAGSMVVIPYKSAPGSARYFLTARNLPC